MNFDELFGILLKRCEDMKSDILTIQDMVDRLVDDESLYELRDWLDDRIAELENPVEDSTSIYESLKDNDTIVFKSTGVNEMRDNLTCKRE